MNNKKYKKVVLQALILFMFAIVMLCKISVFAKSEDDKKTQTTYHGIVKYNYNGKSHVDIIDGKEDEVVLKYKKEYTEGQIITIVIKNGKVTNDKITQGNDLKKIVDKYEYEINQERERIIEMK